jgi:hypothetical protein
VVRLCVLKWIKIQNILRAKSTYKRIMDVYQSGLDNDVSEICLGNEKKIKCILLSSIFYTFYRTMFIFLKKKKN